MAQKLVYIAGPIRGTSDGTNCWILAQNTYRAATLALEVWRLGAACLCPHLNTYGFQGALPNDDWLVGDLTMLARCDAVLLVPGWEHSVGAKAERQFARDRGIPVFMAVRGLALWLQDQTTVQSKGAPA